MKHTLELKLPENSIDDKGNILPDVVLNIFQEAANVHGRMLGVSFEEMLKKNLLWVITRIKYEVLADINSGQEIMVTTWPLKPSRIGYERDYIISDKSGKVIIKGTSNWALIDANTRRLSFADNLYNCSDYCEERAFENKSKRIRNFDSENKTGDIIPDESMIDLNNHVNNTYYASFARKALGGFSGKINAFQIDYHREVLCGQQISMFVYESENVTLVKGEDTEKALMFCCSVEYK